MILNDLKRQRRLHRKLNDSTHLSDYKKRYVDTPISGIVAEISKLSLWQRLLNWFKSLWPTAQKSN